MGEQQINQNVGIWQALFEFAQRVGADDPVNATLPVGHQISENKKWLEEALNTLVEESDPIRLMKKQIKILLELDLKNPMENDQQSGASSLISLNDLVEDVDNASDFFKIGGLRIVIPLLASSYSKFRSLAAELIGNLSQNHPYCQEELVKYGILPLLCALLSTDEDSEVRLKALYAISCTVRDNIKAQSNFASGDGLSFLLRAFESGNDRLKTKVAFLLRSLLRDNLEWKQQALSLDIIKIFASAFGRINDQCSEQTMAALLSLIRNFPDAVNVCCTDGQLKNIVTERIAAIESQAEYEEELATCREIHKICWPIE